MTSTTRSTLIGAGIGGAVMFLADPNHGARRRALIRDKFTWMTRKTRDAAGSTWRDLGNRTAGLQARVHGLSIDNVDDTTLTERIRSALGRATSHSRAVSVDVLDGWVTLTGDALTSESAAIIAAVNAVHGVEGVTNRLRTHAAAGSIPTLHGGSNPRRWATWLWSGWSPTAKLVAASLGAAALATTRRRAA